MCAIFGIIGEDNPRLIRMMSKVQEFRGPDKQNFYFDEENKLNLEIIDYQLLTLIMVINQWSLSIKNSL